MSRLTNRKIVYLALLISLNVVLTRIASIRFSIGGVESLRVGFGPFPVILAGITFGPAAGGIVGALGDIIGFTINPMGPFMPHFTLTAALTGMIPAFVIKLFKRPVPSSFQLFVAIFVGQFISGIILNPLFLQITFNMPVFATLPGKIITQALQIPAYTILAEIVLKRSSIMFNPNM
ncbi:MAG: folate family ECF transporter S component [Thermoanaerobacterales bacterium]|jgi:ECF transporter S component (folate family)|nr:folate family ECF transporter S component [Thermoanaerobacterales bacterium]